MPRQNLRVGPYAAVFVVFALVLIAVHGPYLRLPYFWDELGQFVPAALDILQHGQWIPHSTTPNVHPPGVMAYLALFWRIAGYSIAATRVAMLLLGAAAVVAVFLLAIHMCATLKGAPAFMPVALLLASPLFYMQSMFAQLDMPAMLFTVLVLLLFLQDRTRDAALASTVLVLVKETGLIVPVVLAGWLLREKRFREAAYFVAPTIVLVAWIIYLRHGTGHWLGDSGFAHYNVFYPLHPVRLSISFLRRGYYLFVENFHWIGTAAIIFAWRKTSIYRTRAWAIVASVFVAHSILVSVLGGATLERYLLPVIPLFYIAVGVAWSALPPLWRGLSQAAMFAGLLAGFFWNPLWPFPFENNLAAVDFVRLQAQAAEYVEQNYPDKLVASAWTFPDALRRPEFGYVSRSIAVKGIENFHRDSIAGLKGDSVGVLVVYSRTWEPKMSVLHVPWIANLLARYYDYEPQIKDEDIAQDLGLYPRMRWEQHGQWIEVYAREGSPEILVRAVPPVRKPFSPLASQ